MVRGLEPGPKFDGSSTFDFDRGRTWGHVRQGVLNVIRAGEQVIDQNCPEKAPKCGPPTTDDDRGLINARDGYNYRSTRRDGGGFGRGSVPEMLVSKVRRF